MCLTHSVLASSTTFVVTFSTFVVLKDFTQIGTNLFLVSGTKCGVFERVCSVQTVYNTTNFMCKTFYVRIFLYHTAIEKPSNPPLCICKYGSSSHASNLRICCLQLPWLFSSFTLQVRWPKLTERERERERENFYRKTVIESLSPWLPANVYCYYCHFPAVVQPLCMKDLFFS